MPLAVAFQPAASSAPCAATGSTNPGPRFGFFPGAACALSGLGGCRARTGSLRRASAVLPPRASPVLPSLFHRLQLVPEYLMLRAVGLDHHPVLPGLHHRSRAAAPNDRVRDLRHPIAPEERPWAAYARGQPLTPRQLATLLAGFQIRPSKSGKARSRARGY